MDQDTKINEMEITDEFVMADSATNVREIANKLQKLREETDHGAVLVTKDEREVIGFITQKEIVDLMITETDPSQKAAEDIMNTDFMNIREDQTLGNVIPLISEKYPNSIVVTDPEGRCVGYFSKNDYSDALAALGIYDKSQEPKSKNDWRTRGIAMSSSGDKAEALKCYEKSIESSSDKEKSWSRLAKSMEKNNRVNDALMCYDKALEINSENDEIMLEKGKLYSEENTEDLAVQNYKKALEMNPNNVEAWMNIGMEQANSGNIEDALQSLDKASALKSQSPEIWFKKGSVYEKAEKYEKAIECYTQTIELNDHHEEAWFNKGVALKQLGKRGDALQCLIRLLQINPANESAREALNTWR